MSQGISSTKVLIYEVIYYLIILAIITLMFSDVPVRVRFWYHMYRWSQGMAREMGRVGLYAESHYHNELEKSRTI